ncbi:hypothetical protein CP970_42775 [Streptomyces kanamyceticus]|uniref:Uncharacterized protein n=1 Tax=Streptomyces kanamyceticus TaxID=1967 RepID=A0A5J6GUM7_STRKN|nr:hypothetical protein [Streptomyces kanamyceticus]QEU96776.1 hypothetical protein CP970_42775 [Streptomyces kanamyceticus]
MPRNTTTPRRGRVRRLAVALATAGVLAGGAFAVTSPASASTFCGDTGDGGYGCVIDQGDGTFKMVNSHGDIVYNW